MKVAPVQTHPLVPEQDTDIFGILDRYLPRLLEGTVVAITSKIVSICEGRFVKYESEEQKERIIQKEAEYYLPRSSSKYDVFMTIKGGGMNFSSGVDESNGAGYLTLWPKDPQETANSIREHLVRAHGIRDVGVVLTDTTSVPLRWGQRGVYVLAHSGFSALNSYIGKKDLFGREFKMTSAAVADALGGAAVLVMGEGAESTPLAVIDDIPFVHFQGRNPSEAELKELTIEPENDLFGPLLQAVKWEKGGSA